MSKNPKSIGKQDPRLRENKYGELQRERSSAIEQQSDPDEYEFGGAIDEQSRGEYDDPREMCD